MSIEKVILLIGLPGSGKTTLGNILQQDAPSGSSLFIDDMSLLTDNAKVYFKNIQSNTLKQLIIADIYFCQTKVREAAFKIINEVFPNASIETIFFENNIDKCKINVAHRTAKGDEREVLGMLVVLNKLYKIPENQTVQEIKTQ